MRKIKETYLLFLIVIGLISLSLYTTYALFISTTTLDNVVGFNTTLSIDSNFLEYEMITVEPGDSKIIELNITNSYEESLYYGAWYEIMAPFDTSNINLGVYTDQSTNSSSGQIASGDTILIIIGITNLGTEDAVVNIGTVGSLTSNLNLPSNRTLLPTGWKEAIIVTDEVIEENTRIEENDTLLEYTTPEMTEITLDAGKYLLETWGAQGGNYSSTYPGGLGGYSYGTLTLNELTTAYVYVGGQGVNDKTRFAPGGFNGGGAAGFQRGGPGGGASDIRIGTDSLYARVIVAGGGGGTWGISKSGFLGGYGGGITGGDGNTLTFGYAAKGATLTAGGEGNGYAVSTSGSNGTFGVGGNASSDSEAYNYSSGGGGGWYGGGGSGYRDSSTSYSSGGSGAGGGSGFVFTEEYAQYTNSTYTGGEWLLDSKYYLTNAATIGNGTTTFTDFDGTTGAVGHSGNGAVRITGIPQTIYSIPILSGLTDIAIAPGTSINMMEGITLECETGTTGCSLIGVDITDTSTLAIGEYTAYYTVRGSDNNIYKYPRIVRVLENFEKLNTKAIGTYVAYVGNNGCTENYCLGYNANQTSTSGTTFGYCDNSSYQFTTYGWRIAYIDGGNTYLVSAGAPECIKNSTYQQTGPFYTSPSFSKYNEHVHGSSYSFNSSTGYFTLNNTQSFVEGEGNINNYKYTCFDDTDTCTVLYEILEYEYKANGEDIDGANANVYYNSNVNTLISAMNSEAQKYCNTTYVDGSSCSTSNTWAIGNDDYYKMTYAISGTGSNLASSYGTPSCLHSETEKCGYNNDLLDNGGFYWFSSDYSGRGLYWNASVPQVSYTSSYTADAVANMYGIRPIIKLSSEVYITGGSGTMSAPYIIGYDNAPDN